MRTITARQESIRQQSGVLAYRERDDGSIEVALVSTNRTGGWTIPKGGVEEGESLRQSAKREAWEEAGLRGKVYREPLGRYVYRKKRTGEKQRVTVFAMRVDEELFKYPEVKTRKRKWVRLGSVSRLLPDLRQLVSVLHSRIEEKEEA